MYPFCPPLLLVQQVSSRKWKLKKKEIENEILIERFVCAFRVCVPNGLRIAGAQPFKLKYSLQLIYILVRFRFNPVNSYTRTSHSDVDDVPTLFISHHFTAYYPRQCLHITQTRSAEPKHMMTLMNVAKLYGILGTRRWLCSHSHSHNAHPYTRSLATRNGINIQFNVALLRYSIRTARIFAAFVCCCCCGCCDS